jgi:hypothetical protein
MAESEIGKTTTFSGTDIDVVAYRGIDTPAQKFAIDKIKKDIEKLDSGISSQKKLLLQKEQEIVATQKNLNLQADKIRELRSVLPEGSSAASNLVKKEGKLQNQISQQSTELLDLKSGLTSMNVARGLLEDDQKKLEAGADSFFRLGSLHTLSYSSFREKFAVRTLGRIQAKTYTRGPRTIAGSLVFNVLQSQELMRLLKVRVFDEEGRPEITKVVDKENQDDPRTVMVDQLQPFNLLLLFANEFGSYSALHLLDIDINAEGQEMSIDNIVTHNSMNFYAKEMIPMQNLGNRFNSYNEMITGTIRDVGTSGSTSGEAPNKKRIDAMVNPFAEDKQARLISGSRGLF